MHVSEIATLALFKRLLSHEHRYRLVTIETRSNTVYQHDRYIGITRARIHSPGVPVGHRDVLSGVADLNLQLSWAECRRIAYIISHLPACIIHVRVRSPLSVPCSAYVRSDLIHTCVSHI